MYHRYQENIDQVKQNKIEIKVYLSLSKTSLPFIVIAVICTIFASIKKFAILLVEFIAILNTNLKDNSCGYQNNDFIKTQSVHMTNGVIN